MPLVM